MSIVITIKGKISDDRIGNLANKSTAIFDKYHIDVRNEATFERGPEEYLKFLKRNDCFSRSSDPILQIQGLTSGGSHWTMSKLDSLKEDLEKTLEIKVSIN